MGFAKSYSRRRSARPYPARHQSRASPLAGSVRRPVVCARRKPDAADGGRGAFARAARSGLRHHQSRNPGTRGLRSQGDAARVSRGDVGRVRGLLPAAPDGPARSRRAVGAAGRRAAGGRHGRRRHARRGSRPCHRLSQESRGRVHKPHVIRGQVCLHGAQRSSDRTVQAHQSKFRQSALRPRRHQCARASDDRAMARRN